MKKILQGSNTGFCPRRMGEILVRRYKNMGIKKKKETQNTLEIADLSFIWRPRI